MIPIFIPSKDRAAQLDLLLRSLLKNADNIFVPYVMYTFSNDRYKDGYSKVIEKHSNWVNFIKETNAEEHFYGFLRSNTGQVGLFTDDCIFYRPANFTESDIFNFLSYKYVWGFHARLGLNITIVDYIKNTKCPQPNFIYQDANFLCWDYRFYDKFQSYFAFPTPFDGSFYNSVDLLNLANNGSFGRILFWERMICQNGRQELMNKNLVVSPTTSCVIAQQVNSSHEFGHYTNHSFNASLELLNNNFLNGNVIDLDSMDFTNVNSAHGELSWGYKLND